MDPPPTQSIEISSKTYDIQGQDEQEKVADEW